MGQPSFPNNDRWRIERLEAAVTELYRRRPRTQPNLRDLNDINGWGAADGHVVMYDTTTGKYKPVLAPPTLAFNQTGTLTVSASDEAPMGSSGKLFLVQPRLKTTGSGTTTAVLKKNASTVVTTFTFASGSHTATWTALANTSFVAVDYFWLDTTAIGSGAAGLVVYAWAQAA